MRAVTGVYDVTTDSRPVSGGIPGTEGVYVCAGFSGMGFTIFPAIGLVMSELVPDGSGQTVHIREMASVLNKLPEIHGYGKKVARSRCPRTNITITTN